MKFHKNRKKMKKLGFLIHFQLFLESTYWKVKITLFENLKK